MKILVTGGAGFLGSNWLRKINSDSELFATVHRTSASQTNVKYIGCNLTSEAEVKNTIETISPDLIIHTAALTDVDRCEKYPEEAAVMNVTATRNIALALSGTQCKLLHISTDQLYDGKKKFCTETDILKSLNIYGKTKAQAEEEVRKYHSNHLILRTNFYGLGTLERNSFYDWCKKVIVEKSDASFYENVFFTPVFIDDLIHNSFKMLNEVGTYNFVGNERISKAEFGLLVAKSLRKSADHIKLVAYAQGEGKALRPLEMSLSNDKLKKIPGISLHSLEDSLELIKN